MAGERSMREPGNRFDHGIAGGTPLLEVLPVVRQTIQRGKHRASSGLRIELRGEATCVLSRANLRHHGCHERFAVLAAHRTEPVVAVVGPQHQDAQHRAVVIPEPGVGGDELTRTIQTIGRAPTWN